MKKLLLSSIIMFGVCGFVTAQNATGSKFKKAETPTNATATTPQKAAMAPAIAPALATNDVDPVQPASDKIKPVAPAAVKSPKQVVKPVEAIAVGADGVVIAKDDAAKREIEKAEAAKAAGTKKNKDN